ncbi:MAG TPA: hypothetical protein VGM39_03795 [Kofleriaceae bacterium]|jgi:hypothetical protein
MSNRALVALAASAILVLLAMVAITAATGVSQETFELVLSPGDYTPGFVHQGYDLETGTYVMMDALLPGVRWIPTDPPLVDGKGTPAFTYLTLRTMKGFGIAAGSLRRLVVRANHHVESVLQLAQRELNGRRDADDPIGARRAFSDGSRRPTRPARGASRLARAAHRSLRRACRAAPQTSPHAELHVDLVPA